MVVDAWDSVSPETIRKCWAMTEVKDSDSQESLAKSLKEIEKHTHQKSASPEEFLKVDQAVPTSEEKSDEDIVLQITNEINGITAASDDEEEEEESPWEPPLKNALAGAIVEQEYCEFFGFDDQDLKAVNRIKEKLQRQRVESSQQSAITLFFTKTS